MSNRNRKSWNLSMPLHQKIMKSYYDNAFENRDFNILSSYDRFYFHEVLRIVGKSVVQLCCNNGVELMSLCNMGAAETTGYDLCDVAISEGKQRCHELGYSVELFQSDILELDIKNIHQYDIVYLSVGSIRWIKEMDKLYSICHRFLKKNGSLYISDVHPFAEVINDNRKLNSPPLEIIESYRYCQKIDRGSLDYVGHTDNLLVEREWYIHTLSEIIGKLPSNNFYLKMFEESEEDLSGVYQLAKSQKVSIPLSFRLEAIAK